MGIPTPPAIIQYPPSWPAPGDPGADDDTDTAPKPSPAAKKSAERKTKKHPGIPHNARIRLDGKWAGPTEIETINEILDVAESKYVAAKLGHHMQKALLSLVCANIGESNYDKFVRGGFNGDYWGIYQLSASWRSRVNYLNLTALTKRFLIGGGFAAAGDALTVIKAHPDWTPGMIAGAVEGSDKQGAAAERYYGAFRGLADDIIKAYGGVYTNGTPDSASGDESVAKEFDFTRPYPASANPYQDSWACARALADEVGWSLFAQGDRLYYFSEPRLAAQTPTIISRTDDALAPFLGHWRITRNNDVDAASAEFDVICHPRAFHAGQAVLLDGFGGGSADRWLIAETRRSMFEESTHLTLKKAKYPQPEPAHDTMVRDNGSDGENPEGDGKPAGAPAAASIDTADVYRLTPREVIEKFVLPVGRAHGLKNPWGQPLTADNVAAANAAHGHTVNGNTSDHEGPGSRAWAADMSNGTSPTPQMDACAKELARMFGIPHKAGQTVFPAAVSRATWGGFRFQLIYRVSGDANGGNHMNHNHFGVQRVG